MNKLKKSKKKFSKKACNSNFHIVRLCHRRKRIDIYERPR